MANAKKIGRTEVIELNDGTEVTLRPLNIKRLREFMAKFKTIQDIPDDALDYEAQFLDIMVDMAAISLQDQLPEATAFLHDDKKDRDQWETMVDQDSVAYVNEVCGGIKLGGGSDEDFTRGTEV